MNNNAALADFYQRSLASARDALDDGRVGLAWEQLERAHLIGQARFVWHWQVHCRMLALAWRQADATEIAGQLLRLSLVPLGHLIGRLPIGNVGSTRVGALSTAALPDDIAKLLASAERGRK